MKTGYSAVLACVGAVIGAGFASGREVVTFFTQYGIHGWWLIALAVLVMTGLCWICMQSADSNDTDWMKMLRGGCAAQLCSMLLLVLTAGAMISASGHMIALLWNHPQAYGLGALGTLLAAWQMGKGNLRSLSAASGLLTLLLLCALMASVLKLPAQAVSLNVPMEGRTLFAAAVHAVGYASMNMMLAIGVVCQSAGQTKKHWQTAGLFGWLIGMLLMISQYVYSRFPEAEHMAFPIVALLAGYGRTGYLAGAALLYLSILTTLASVLYALRSAAQSRINRRDVRMLLVLGVPLAVSGIGFEAIVDRFYAPAGWICLAALFLPMAYQHWKSTFS